MTEAEDELFAVDELASARNPDTGRPPPQPPELDPTDRRTRLQWRLRTVLAGLPGFFEFHNSIAGVDATDLHSLNTLLGASIETQVVRTLNQQRRLWDPDDEWLGFTFERQSQRFPDVRLVQRGGADARPRIALGIELKGWFLLAKEGEPSFRFTTTPAACAPHDLLVVVPWHLDNVLAGSPVAAEPFVVSARWAAEYRNHYWQFSRGGVGLTDRSIAAPAGAAPYPGRDAVIADQPAHDGGKNFGRVARVPGLMTEFVEACKTIQALGIPIGDWYRFLRRHSDQADPDEVSEWFARDLRAHLRQRSEERSAEAVAAALRLTRALSSGRDF